MICCQYEGSLVRAKKAVVCSVSLLLYNHSKSLKISYPFQLACYANLAGKQLALTVFSVPIEDSLEACVYSVGIVIMTG